MSAEDFDVGGALARLTGMEWREIPVHRYHTGVSRAFEATGPGGLGYSAHVAADGDTLAAVVGPADRYGAPSPAPVDGRDGTRVLGRRVGGLSATRVVSGAGAFWALSLDTSRLEGTGFEPFAAPEGPAPGR